MRVLASLLARCQGSGRNDARRMAEGYALLFPGQGSQYVGMTGRLADTGAVSEIFEVAHRVLGYDLRALCLRGPEEELERTARCQPAVVAASLVALEALRQREPQVRVWVWSRVATPISAPSILRIIIL